MYKKEKLYFTYIHLELLLQYHRIQILDLAYQEYEE